MRDIRLEKRWGIKALVVMCLAMWMATGTCLAAGPQLIVNRDLPDAVSAGEEIHFELSVENVGDQTTSGPITVTDTTRSGLSAPEEEFNTAVTSSEANAPAGPLRCETLVTTLTCVFEGQLPPGAQLFLVIKTLVGAEATGALRNEFAVTGGGTTGTSAGEDTMTVGSPGPFGFTEAAATFLNADGSATVQAGAVPSEFTTSLTWRTFSSPLFGQVAENVNVGHFEDVITHLPVGLIGNPSSTPALCTADELARGAEHCPSDSQIGLAHVYLTVLRGFTASLYTPLFNMATPYGVATELGFEVFHTSVLLYAQVRPDDNGIDVVSKNTSTSAPIPKVDVTVWGVPSNPSHDRYRTQCIDDSTYLGALGLTCPASAPRKAFLRMPTSCSGEPISFGVESNTYEEPNVFARADFVGPEMKGCERVPFAPDLHVNPTGTAADSPTGMSVKLSLPQSQDPQGLAESDLKKAVVTLPEGMSLNPSSADGLQACDDAHLHLDSNTPADCPDASKLGTVVLQTQLIANQIEGLIYLRPQNSSDPESGEMFRIAIELRDDSHGLDFKVAGHVAADPRTGRLTAIFDNNPQLPFEDISLKFKGGARAPLVTPASCTPQTTESNMYSWARPDVPVHRASTFTLTSGPEGTPCASQQPFAPGFEAGVKSVQAGAFTPFLTTFTRKDADQSMQRVSVKMPPGLQGSLIGVPLCPEAQANAGTCGQASEIGTVTAGAGAGPTPFYVTGGKVFMTGPYEGAPFGLSVVVPAKAGPFDLGTVVVRAKVEVDIHTAQLTVTTDPLPQVVSGVPVNLRLVNVTINRPSFTYNPTNCDPMDVSGSMIGGQGAVAHVENHFQVTNCGALAFKPAFHVSTSAKTSRQNGASLHVLLTYPNTPRGTQANIKSVHVELPKALPSRLTTLNHACLDSVFNQNPANCPSESRVGYAKATTPVIPVPLEGPAYFVSHGGERFPELIVVLQGYGVTIDLAGETFISKAGITSSTFNSVPDVPVGSFELTLPAGKFSALAANRNLCTAGLAMPIKMTAQNGAVLEQKTKIAVSGCKPAIRVLRHSVKGSSATIVVHVLSSGRLVASGGAVKRSVKQAGKAGNVTIGVTLTSSDLSVLERHPHQHINANVTLRFIPKHGAPLTAHVKLLLG